MKGIVKNKQWAGRAKPFPAYCLPGLRAPGLSHQAPITPMGNEVLMESAML